MEGTRDTAGSHARLLPSYSCRVKDFFWGVLQAVKPKTPTVWESPDAAKQVAAKILKSALPLPKVPSLSHQPSEVELPGESEERLPAASTQETGVGDRKWWAHGGSNHQPPPELRRKVGLLLPPPLQLGPHQLTSHSNIGTACMMPCDDACLCPTLLLLP